MDLVLGVFLIGLASLTSFWLGRAFARRVPSRFSGLGALIVLVLLIGFALFVYGRLLLVRLLPFSNAVVLANGIAPGVALLGGIMAGQDSLPVWRRNALAAMMAGLAVYTALFDVAAPAPPRRPPQFRDGFAVQTNSASCSPCCAVSLLMEHNIRATEAEMMRLCLTRRTGTPELGLYRGLRLKTHGSPWQVEFFTSDLPTLRQQLEQPVLLIVDTVGAPTSAWWRWRQLRLANHAVVLYGFRDDGRIEIGDPGIGRVRWDYDEFASRWRGKGLRLVPRDANRSSAACGETSIAG
jgi:hypothetical protein